MWNHQQGTPQYPHWADPEGIVREMMENAALGSSIHPTDPCMSYSPNAGYLQGLTVGGTFDEHTAGPPSNEQRPMLQPPVCYTPPDSVTSVTTPSPSGAQTDANMSSHQENNFDCTSLLVPSPDPSTRFMASPSQTPLWDRVNSLSPSASVHVQSTASRFASQRPKVISARCSQAAIEILNPKDEYDKIQKKHGPRGKFSEQRIQNGMVEMRIRTCLQLIDLEVYVQRELEAEKKLTQKDPSAYGVGPTRIPKLQTTPVSRSDSTLELFTYICKFDLDCVYKTPDKKEVYKLEKSKGTEYNRFQLRVYLQFAGGSSVVLYPYEFVLKSSKTGKTATATNTSTSASRPLSAGPSQQVPSDTLYSRLMCQQLEAEFAKIKTVECEQIRTKNHDIAYYIKRKHDESEFEEGDVVGFFVSATGETVIDLLTSENAGDARLAGVISRSAYLVGNTERNDSERNDADLVCIIGEIEVKVVGKVRTGECIYTCPSDKFPGTATTQRHRGNHRQTLLGYSLGESSSTGVSKVDCLVSLVLSVSAKDRLRELDHLNLCINQVRESMEMHIDSVSHRISSMQRGRRGLWKKLLGILLFLVAVSLVCGLMLPPNSPYVKKKCREGSMGSNHYFTFKYYPDDGSEEGIPVRGLEFEWKVLKKKLNLDFDKIQPNQTKYDSKGFNYYMNQKRCETGGIRSIASWLDPTPTVPHVNVLAVDKNCSKVFYHNKKEGSWSKYKKNTVDELKCYPH